jgi:hypothetical protein
MRFSFKIKCCVAEPFWFLGTCWNSLHTAILYLMAVVQYLRLEAQTCRFVEDINNYWLTVSEVVTHNLKGSNVAIFMVGYYKAPKWAITTSYHILYNSPYITVSPRSDTSRSLQLPLLLLLLLKIIIIIVIIITSIRKVCQFVSPFLQFDTSRKYVLDLNYYSKWLHLDDLLMFKGNINCPSIRYTSGILLLPLALQPFVSFGFLRQVIPNFSIRC